MKYKDIEKEILKELRYVKTLYVKTFSNPDGRGYHDGSLELAEDVLMKLIKAKINQVIDEMIGEEKKIEGKWIIKNCTMAVDGKKIGYNQKVRELKEYKNKFNL